MLKLEEQCSYFIMLTLMYFSVYPIECVKCDTCRYPITESNSPLRSDKNKHSTTMKQGIQTRHCAKPVLVGESGTTQILIGQRTKRIIRE